MSKAKKTDTLNPLEIKIRDTKERLKSFIKRRDDVIKGNADEEKIKEMNGWVNHYTSQ